MKEILYSLKEWLHGLVEWTEQWALIENPPGSGIITLTPYATLALFINAFAGSSFFPVPPDILLIGMCLASPQDALWFASVCLLGSTLGGMFGYLIGIRGGKPVLRKFVTEERIEQIHSYFEKYQEWAIGIAGFTPVPYKVFAIAAGVFYIDFKKYVLITILSRGSRFFIVAGLLKLYGQQAKNFIEQHFDMLSILLVILLIGGFAVMKYVKVPHDEKTVKETFDEPGEDETGEKKIEPSPV